MDRLRADATTALQNITQADAQLNKCLGALRSNLDHVAMQVRTNLARQADSLRMREAWLLKQLELVHADKTEVLTRQRDRLAQAAESLRTCLQNPNCSENQMVDCLDRLVLRLNTTLWPDPPVIQEMNGYNQLQPVFF